MSIFNKRTNIVGTKLPQWVVNQLTTRSIMGALDTRNNSNLIYLANKTAWVRLVSSININEADIRYFSPIVPEGISSPEDLAQKFVLFGGTSKYKNIDGKPSYELRSGINNGSYGMLGKDEIQKYGYRPMPGITSVNIETQGRMGSVRQAVINFKCWDKSQLDIIDALYFKLGYTMFLEWGHTNYYPSIYGGMGKPEEVKLVSTELNRIDPFQKDLTKEKVFRLISQNSRETDGNYDAMLGVVTNFNFAYNQEGGYDCTVRIMSLGLLADSIKINNPSALPNLLRDEILLLKKTLEDVNNTNNQGTDSTKSKNEGDDLLTLEQLINKYLRLGNGKFPDGSFAYTDSTVKPEQGGGPVSGRPFADVYFKTPAYGEVFGIRKLKGYIPLDGDYYSLFDVTLNYNNFYQILNYKNFSFVDKNNSEENKPVFTEALKATLKVLIGNNPTSIISDIAIAKAVAVDQITRKSTIQYNKITYDKINRGINNNIEIERSIFAVSNEENIDNPYYYVSDSEFEKSLEQFISAKNQVKIKKIEKKLEDQDNWPGYYKTVFTFQFDLVFNKPSIIEEKYVENAENKVRKTESRSDYVMNVTITTDDTALIETFNSDSVIQPADFIENQKAVEKQNQEELRKAEQQKLDQEVLSSQILDALAIQSALEIILRTIQVKSLNHSYDIGGGIVDLEIQRTVHKYEMFKDPEFLNQIFSNGLYSKIIQRLLDPKSINNADYLKSDEDQFLINAKYGFSATLLGSNSKDSDIFNDIEDKYVDYQQLLTSYVVPYQIDQDLIVGVKTNHPVYITLGTVLMLLNHCCTLYDTKLDSAVEASDLASNVKNAIQSANKIVNNLSQGFQKPLVYIDYNQKLNFLLTNAKQLSTNPWVTLIPFEGTDEDYKQLFDESIIEGNSIIAIKEPGKEDSKSTPLFKPSTEDLLSFHLPRIKDGESAYRGKLMNVLINIDYLTEIVRTYSFQDGTNNVYLKQFLEQIMSDVNKYLGNFNALRVSYNDTANTIQIVDDQVIPPPPIEELLTPTDNRTEIPLVGLNSIAKSLEIKTEIPGRLGNLIAISANSDIKEQAQASLNADSVGFINVNYTDRYIPRKLSGPDIKTATKNGEIISSIQFNQSATDFYSKITPSYTDVSQMTAFYINKMSKVKNNERGSRASNMIPVSVNIKTDGIGGLSMGHSFTISKQLLPYNYSSKKANTAIDGDVNQVGFAVVGLSHNIDGNVWNTSIKASMVSVKDSTDFNWRVAQLRENKNQWGVSNNYGLPFFGPTPNADILRETLDTLGYLEKGREISNAGDISTTMAQRASQLFAFIKERVKGVLITVTGGHDQYHMPNNPGSSHNTGNAIDFVISPASDKDVAAVAKVIEEKASLIGIKFLNEYDKPSENATAKHFHIYI